MLSCPFRANEEILTSNDGELWCRQAQNGVNYDKPKFEIRGQSFHNAIAILTSFLCCEDHIVINQIRKQEVKETKFLDVIT